MLERSDEGRAWLEAKIERYRAAMADTKTRLNRIYDAIEAGLSDLADPFLKDRIDALKLQIREGTAAVEALQKRRSIRPIDLSTERLQAFSAQVRERLRSGDPAFRRAWLQLFVDEVRVGPEAIYIRGPKEPLIAIPGDNLSGPEVPNFAWKWRSLREELPRHQPFDSQGFFDVATQLVMHKVMQVQERSSTPCTSSCRTGSRPAPRHCAGTCLHPLEPVRLPLPKQGVDVHPPRVPQRRNEQVDLDPLVADPDLRVAKVDLQLVALT